MSEVAKPTSDDWAKFIQLMDMYEKQKRKIKIPIVCEDKFLPEQKGNGLDLRSTEEVLIKPGHRITVGTGVKVKLPGNYSAKILPRSGNANKSGITVVNSPGLIDSERDCDGAYIGEIKVILLNTDLHHTFHVGVGDRIAQITIEETKDVEWDRRQTLEQTSRGENGLGSTGKK